MLFLALNENVFVITKIVMFFVAVVFVFRALQAIDLTKIFRANSSDQIRFIFMAISIVIGYLLVDAVVSILQLINGLF
ncbi:MAG TPA: DUF1146 family protein [Bacillota bacterium]|nr:DUF1146 family protein [Bacillota bacterium]